MPYLEKVEDVKSPKKLSSSKSQEEKKSNFLGWLNESQKWNYLFIFIYNLKPIEIIFKGIKLMFFIVLFALAGIFAKDVIQQFQAKDTFIGQSLKNITKHD